MIAQASSNLHVSTHPLVAHKITLLSDKHTGIVLFRQLVAELTQLVLYEATTNLPMQTTRYESPLETTPGEQIAARIGLVPILRAGLGMVDKAAELLPFAAVYHIGITGTRRRTSRSVITTGCRIVCTTRPCS